MSTTAEKETSAVDVSVTSPVLLLIFYLLAPDDKRSMFFLELECLKVRLFVTS